MSIKKIFIISKWTYIFCTNIEAYNYRIMCQYTLLITLTYSVTLFISLLRMKCGCFICMLVCLLWQVWLFMTRINNMSSKANLFQAGSGIEWMLIDIYCMGRSDTIMLAAGVGYGIKFKNPTCRHTQYWYTILRFGLQTRLKMQYIYYGV